MLLCFCFNVSNRHYFIVQNSNQSVVGVSALHSFKSEKEYCQCRVVFGNTLAGANKSNDEGALKFICQLKNSMSSFFQFQPAMSLLHIRVTTKSDYAFFYHDAQMKIETWTAWSFSVELFLLIQHLDISQEDICDNIEYRRSTIGGLYLIYITSIIGIRIFNSLTYFTSYCQMINTICEPSMVIKILYKFM